MATREQLENQAGAAWQALKAAEERLNSEGKRWQEDIKTQAKRIAEASEFIAQLGSRSDVRRQIRDLADATAQRETLEAELKQMQQARQAAYDAWQAALRALVDDFKA